LLIAPPHLSPSSIATFHQCPLKYKFSRIDGLKEPATEATIRGNFVHSILEGLYAVEKSGRTLQTAKAIASEVWTSYEAEVRSIVKASDINSFRWQSWWCVENLFKLESPTEIEFDGIETELNHSVDGVKIKGFVDRWSFHGDKIRISDYKTGKTPKKQYQADKFDQLLIYAICLSDVHNKSVDLLELVYLKDGVRLTSVPTAGDIDRIRAMIVQVRQDIDERCETEIFEAKTSVLCGWCHFKPICPAWSKKK